MEMPQRPGAGSLTRASDLEVHPNGEALLPVVIIWLAFRALQAEFVLDIDQRGSFVKKIVCSPSTKDITALPK